MSPIIITHRILLEINFYSVCEVRLDSKVYCVLLQLLHLGVHCEVQKAVGTLESQSLYIRDNLESVVRLAAFSPGDVVASSGDLSAACLP